MKIEIKADKDEILGGPDRIPFLKLELSEDGTATLSTGHHDLCRHMAPLEEWSGRKRIGGNPDGRARRLLQEQRAS